MKFQNLSSLNLTSCLEKSCFSTRTRNCFRLSMSASSSSPCPSSSSTSSIARSNLTSTTRASWPPSATPSSHRGSIPRRTSPAANPTWTQCPSGRTKALSRHAYSPRQKQRLTAVHSASVLPCTKGGPTTAGQPFLSAQMGHSRPASCCFINHCCARKAEGWQWEDSVR